MDFDIGNQDAVFCRQDEDISMCGEWKDVTQAYSNQGGGSTIAVAIVYIRLLILNLKGEHRSVILLRIIYYSTCNWEVIAALHLLFNGTLVQFAELHQKCIPNE